MTNTVGLALSGGGSRAAAFHRGTIQGLLDLALIDKIDVVSTVSGGSIFAAAWMAARVENTSDTDFLARMKEELERGFVLRTLRPRLIKAIIPGFGYTRTDAIAKTFDKIFFQNKTIGDLPNRPALCINTTILNNGQVGKFSREGFSAWGLRSPDSIPEHLAPIPEFSLALAATASAAFPFGLPPVILKRKKFPTNLEFEGDFEGARAIALTDGGVLENLGIQTLIKSRRFRTQHLIVSDAGTAETTWKPGSPVNTVKSFGVWFLSGRILDRLLQIMNNKQNRWARQSTVQMAQSSAGAIPDGTGGPSNLLFLRVNQRWNSLLSGVPRYKLQEISERSGVDMPASNNADEVARFFKLAGIDLTTARRYYDDMGADKGVVSLNGVSTSFTGLSSRILDQLAAHAAWQVHATHAIYWQ